MEVRYPFASKPTEESSRTRDGFASTRDGCATLRQRDALERADHVVGAFFGKEAFVIAGTEIPVGAFVIIVTVKTPDAVHDNETTDAVIPVIADIMETQVRSREGALETGVIGKFSFI